MSEKALNQSTKQNVIEEYMNAERGGQRTANGKSGARVGSNRWHNLLVSNTAIALGSRMHGHKCDIYISNMRVKMRNNFICFPDVVIVNGEPSFADQNADLLLNPTLVVEIFSGETSSSDKTRKLEHFLETESIREVFFIKEDEMRVEHYARQNAKQWIYRIYNERDDVMSADSINTKVSLSEIYAQIKFRGTEISSRAVN